MEDFKNLKEKFIQVMSETSIEKPMTETKIALRIGLKDGATLRDLVVSPLACEGFPIGIAGRKGIFLARSADQLEHTKARLISRMFEEPLMM